MTKAAVFLVVFFALNWLQSKHCDNVMCQC